MITRFTRTEPLGRRHTVEEPACIQGAPRLGLAGGNNILSFFSTEISLGQYYPSWATEPHKNERPTVPNYYLRENNMEKSLSTITFTEHGPIANASLDLISGSSKTDCGHPQLKSFKFSDGQTIHMCPDCNQFDGHRHAVLAGAEVGTTPRLHKTRK